jgi:hypothetical protein
MAHPGIRDSATVTYTRPPGKTRKYPLVRVCEQYDPIRGDDHHHLMGDHPTSANGNNGDSNSGVGGDSGGATAGCYCQQGRLCKKYHLYVRPSTREIIMKIYPRENGEMTKHYLSGARLHGNVVRKEFVGYGVMTWPSRAVYIGDWRGGKRHGLGIFRSPDGTEYVGGWENGARHGRG